MTVTNMKHAYWSGVRDGLPYIVVVVPFATLFGIVAIDAGLTLAQTLSFSILVIAGASQFAALQLMLENAAISFILVTALAINLRMAMYSAALAPHLGSAALWQRVLIGYLNFDQSYILSIAKYENEPDMLIVFVYIFWRACGFSYPNQLRGIIRLADSFFIDGCPND